MTASVKIYPGDNRDTLRRLIDDGLRVDSILCDPPYGLTITDRFGKKDSAPAKVEGTDGSFSRLSRGFMNQMWDGSGIERDPEFWKLALEILKPGAFCLAFGHSSTGHRTAAAMEAAGFIMYPMLAWVYSTGLPKGKDVEKFLLKDGASQDEAAEWAGWKFGVNAPKISLEPIYMAQRPISEKTFVKNIRLHGVGAINVDGCRVPLDPVADASQLRTMNRNQRTEDTSGQTWGYSKNSGQVVEVVNPAGRYPSTLLHDASDQVVDLFSKGGCGTGTQTNKTTTEEVDLTERPHIDYAASSARFFNAFPSSDVDPFIYHPKASKKDRAGSQHPTVKPIGLLRHLIRHITPPGGVVLDPFAGSGTTAVAAREEGFDCILMEAEQEYVDFLHERFGRDRHAAGQGLAANPTDLSDLFLSDSDDLLLV